MLIFTPTVILESPVNQINLWTAGGGWRERTQADTGRKFKHHTERLQAELKPRTLFLIECCEWNYLTQVFGALCPKTSCFTFDEGLF